MSWAAAQIDNISKAYFHSHLHDHTNYHKNLPSCSEDTSVAEIRDLCGALRTDRPSWLCVPAAWGIKHAASSVFALQIGQENH